jgi:hypothetical protein
MKTLLKICFCLSLWLLCHSHSRAQIQVQVMLQPPYPVHYEDYFFDSDQILVQLINTGSTPQSIKLFPTLTGDNGVEAKLKPSYQPVQAIQLQGGQSMLLTFRQLKAYNRGISGDDVLLTGTSVEQLVRDEKLPEGNYTLCVEALDYNTGTLLSTPSTGCAFFPLTHYDPPVVILPSDKSSVPVLLPQFVNFSWTSTGIPGKTRYRMQLSDITQTGVFDPNDAFVSAALQPLFDRSNILVPVLNYSIAEPPLKVDHTYAVRIQAYDPTNSISFKNNGWGPVSTFKYEFQGPGPTGGSVPGGPAGVPIDDLTSAPTDDGGGNPPGQDPTDAPGCFVQGAGTVAEPQYSSTHAPVLNDEVTIGKFKMKVTQANGPNGEGEIFVAFLDTKIKVMYENMQVTAEGVAVGSSLVYATLDQPGLLNDELVKNFTGTMDALDIPYEDIKSFVDNEGNKVSQFSGPNGPAVGVPFSLNTPKNDLYFLGIEFTPTKARANIALGLHFPEALTGAWVNLGMKGIVIRPNGFDLNEGKIALATNKEVEFSDKASLILKANTTYLTFDCSGVDEIKIDGFVEISRQSAVPANAQGTPVAGNETLKANFNTTVESATNWVVEATFSHPQFCLPGMQDIMFSTVDLIYDNSGTANAQGMEFPNNHPKSNPAISKTWTGLYIGELELKLPSWMKSGNQPVEISLEHLLLDKTGVWTSASAENLIDLGDATLGGWGFSIDSFNIVIESSVPAGGSMSGLLQVPVTETGLGYRAAISQGDPETNFLFSVQTEDEVRIDMMIANATLFPNSSITIEKENGTVKPSAILHGTLKIGWGEDDPDGPQENNMVSSFELPTLRFQDLHIFTGNNNVPQIGDFTIDLDNPAQKQGKIAGFNLNLEPPSVSSQGGEIDLGLGLNITLTSGNSNGLSGGAGFSIIGKYDAGVKRFVYDRTELDKISLDIDVAVAHIFGEIEIYQKHETYGNGFRGEIDATIKGLGIGIDVALQVGHVSNYDYFYFDGLLRYDAGFTIPGTAAAIYGFGGGFYYNMIRGEVPEYSYSQYDDASDSYEEVGGSGTGVKFTPSNGDYGFSATVLFGLAGGPQSSAVFNGDVKFSMALKKVNNGISITKMTIEGNAYAIASMSGDRDDASIKGSVKIIMDFIEPSFTLDADLDVNVANGIVTGSAGIALHFSPDEWYVHLGRWNDKSQAAMDEPWTDKERINIGVRLLDGVIDARFFAYFMMGSNMPELPPLPKIIRDRMSNQGGEPIADDRKDWPEANPFSDAGPGFAFGAGVNVGLDFKILIFYVDIDFLIGFDVLLKNYTSLADCESIGINGWYAKGQLYADISVAAGLELDLWFWSGKFELITFRATAVLQAALPNPNWMKGMIAVDATALNGLIRIKTSIKFETGEKPKCLQNQNPFGDYPIVSEITPEKGQADPTEVYDDIRIAFNFPEGVFPVSNENDPELPAKYYFYTIKKFELKHGNQVLETQDINYSADKYSAKYEPYDLLPANATISLYMHVQGFERHKPEVLADEEYKYNFKTKDNPNKIIGQLVEQARPQPRQRYLLQGTPYTVTHMAEDGFIYFGNKDQCYLFKKDYGVDPEQFDVEKTEFLVQYRDLSDGKKYEVPCSCDKGSGVLFSVPQNLKFSQIHELKVLKRLTPKVKLNPQLEGMNDNISLDMSGNGHSNPQGSLSNGGGSDNGGNDNGGDDAENGGGNGGQWMTGSYESEITKGGYKINRALLPHRDMKKVDAILWKSYFRTSKHHTIGQ